MNPQPIILPQELPGQEEFIIAWLGRKDGDYFLVDPGPAATSTVLLEQLRQRGVEKLPWILLTHIHLDHAGGSGHLAAAIPEAKFICHPRGQNHLVDPTRLWAGSRKVQGDTACKYGEPLPIPEDRFTTPEAAGFTALETPGHAPHHQCYIIGDTLFAGEAACTCLATQTGLYLRPATPPRFYLETSIQSLKKLLALAPLPHQIAFGHQCLVANRTRELLNASLDIINRWVQTTDEVITNTTNKGEAIAAAVHELMLERDPWYARFKELAGTIQERETGFTRQSVAGIIGYLESRDQA